MEQFYTQMFLNKKYTKSFIIGKFEEGRIKPDIFEARLVT